MTQEASRDFYVVSRYVVKEPKTDELLAIDADEQGRVLFRTPVPVGKLRQSFDAHVDLLKSLLHSVTQLSDKIEIESVTLKLGIDAQVGWVLLADASLE